MSTSLYATTKKLNGLKSGFIVYCINEQTVRERARIVADIIDKARTTIDVAAGATISRAINILNLDRGELGSYLEFIFARGEHEMCVFLPQRMLSPLTLIC